MTVKEFLFGDILYDKESQQIYNKNGSLVMIRGWAGIRKYTSTSLETCEFQDKLGEFITEAIKEKLKNETKQ